MKLKNNHIKARKKIKTKKVDFAAIFGIVLIVAIGFSLIQSRIGFSGLVGVAKPELNVYFDDLVVAEGSVDTEIEPNIDEADKTNLFFSFNLIDPSEFYEFEVDIVNAGTIDGIVDELILSSLPDNIKQYVSYKVTYTDGKNIKIGDILAAKTTRRIKVVVKFKDNVNMNQIFEKNSPVNSLTFDLSFEINYSPFMKGMEEPIVEENIIKSLGLEESAMDDSLISFADLNENGLYKWHESSEENPIYYYRGNVTDNNVIFADTCWKIVRTTESGGTKLVYNGLPSDGKCSGTSVNIEVGAFNTTRNNAKYVGYMYSDTLTIDSTDATVNTISSNVKAIVDEWYKNNLTEYTGKLEDAIWCNDRATLSSGTTIPFAASETRELDSDVPKPEIMDSKICERDIDRFTVSSGNGNGKLEYPIGLLTADEVLVAGNGINGGATYLTNTNPFWTMTPYRFASRSSNVFVVYEDGMLDGGTVDDDIMDIRPSIVLKIGAKVDSGDGTSNSPYIIG